MMRLDVEGLANTFKLSEGAPEQLGGELIVIKERFLVGVLGRRLLPLLQLLPTAASSMPSPHSLSDQRFVVVNHEEEELKKKMISLWKKQGKAGEGDWARELY
jgi:hypothetical protein